ncbi:hypothetical protein NCS57_01062500 [Fusarium keratoplasticum]|uniref:Uncharacterized protein n=1 Tax=Fusarium keratoplasticum TaxID=1328300 RepID=A0ACC0QP99_9HYPO|nr:hypothetical protein NCS57_01062500 [Fusarium keratoplasticum]KAI8660842.1 hypothetical protein NCS57_01062500 [Fusarium keratoplasticum]
MASSAPSFTIPLTPDWSFEDFDEFVGQPLFAAPTSQCLSSITISAPCMTPSPFHPAKRNHNAFLLESPSYQSSEASRSPLPKKKTVANDANYSCPYRKRNPEVFNVRDHPTCATRSFPSITMVKRHIMSTHLLSQCAEQCENCHSWFRNKNALMMHSGNGMCPHHFSPSTRKCDMGIDQEMEAKLRDRRAICQVLTWRDLWMTIFPGCGEVPSPAFRPVVEGPEALEFFFRSLSVLDGPGRHRAQAMIHSSCDCDDFGEALRRVYGFVVDVQRRSGGFPDFGVETSTTYIGGRGGF